MQKIILFISLFLFAINYLLPQSFSLADNKGVAIVSGSTISINGDTGTIITQKIKIFNNSSSSKTVKVKKVIIDTLTGTENDFCFGGECQMPSIYLSSMSAIIAVGEVDSSFEGGYRSHSVAGTSIVSYVFFDVNNPLDSVYVNIAYTANIPSGITNNLFKQIDFPVVYPNPARNYANFSWSIPNSFKNARIVIRDLVGAVVIEKNINSAIGKVSVDVSELRNGVYFYSLLMNESPYITRKLIVKN